MGARRMPDRDRENEPGGRKAGARVRAEDARGERTNMGLHHRWLALVAAILAVTFTSACRSGEQPTAEPEPTRSEAAAVSTEAPAAPEDVWSRVQDGGTLIVGTSADYPPFQSFDESHELTGFDIALMEAIASELGLAIDWRDIAFDGLGPALVVGQIDAAIAAISVTPEREALVDFSHFYFLGQDAYLAAEGAEVGPIDAVEDLAPYRVGVQAGSVFEELLERALLDTGLMNEHDLFLYVNIEDGFVDLEEGRVDLVVLDRQPALAAAEEGGFEIVAEGLNVERYAIAVAKGQNELRSQINQALLALQDRGTVSELAMDYLDLELDELAALPTPDPVQPTSAPLPPPTGAACIDAMAWVKDLTYDDAGMTNPPVLAPGEAFRKGWQVRNTGTCTWDSSYTLAFAGGNVPGAQMGGQAVAIAGPVTPGQTTDVYVDLVAPIRPGTYRGVWQMRNASSQAFGERVYVGIRVAGSATATPAPTQTPAPGVEFSADRTRIDEGDCTTIRWNVTNIDSVFFYREGQRWEDHGVTGQGSREVCPDRTTTYFLRVVRRDGSVDTRQLTIEVRQNAEAPNIDRFDIEPSGQIAAGQCVTIYWDVSGRVDQVNLLRNGGAIWNGAPQRGKFQDCPSGTGDMTYAIEASGPGGTSRNTHHVNVVPGAPTATPMPTGVPDPVINAFTVTPGQIAVNQCVTIGWSAAGGADRVDLSRNGTTIHDDAGASGTEQDCLGEPGSFQYRLTVTNRAGKSVTADQTVTVEGAAEPTTPPEPTQEPPSISGFGANPPEFSTGSMCTSLSWSVSGSGIALITLYRNDVEIARDPSSGYEDCVDESYAGTTVRYRLRVDTEFAGSTDAWLEVPFGQS